MNDLVAFGRAKSAYIPRGAALVFDSMEDTEAFLHPASDVDLILYKGHRNMHRNDSVSEEVNPVSDEPDFA